MFLNTVVLSFVAGVLVAIGVQDYARFGRLGWPLIVGVPMAISVAYVVVRYL